MVSGDTTTGGGGGYGCGNNAGPDSKVEYFKFTGTGSCVRVEAESQVFQPKMSFFTGDCTFQTCYHYSYNSYNEYDPLDPTLPNPGLTVMATEMGVEYTIVVSGFPFEAGPYTLSLVSADLANCFGAINELRSSYRCFDCHARLKLSARLLQRMILVTTHK